MSFSESQKKKHNSFTDWYNEKYGGDNDIAPVKQYNTYSNPTINSFMQMDDNAFINAFQSGALGSSFRNMYGNANVLDKIEELAPIYNRAKSLGLVTDDDGWFKSSALFDDGYDFGDISRTILSSAGDLVENAVGGALEIGEGVVDAGAFVVGGVADLFGADDFADDTKDFIADDLYDGVGFVKDIGDALTPFDLIDTEENSFFGAKSDSLAQSAGQLAGTYALQAVGIPAWLTMGVTSFGGEVENAFNNGASYGEAGVSGLVTAAAEILTEKISGGISFGGKTLDSALTKTLAQSISNKTVRTLAKIGVDMAGEGAEEVLSGVLSAVGQKLTYNKDKPFSEIFSTEEAFDSFIGGAVLGFGSSSVNAIKSNKLGVDATTGLTANEEKVFNKVYEAEVKAEAEKKGAELTKKEKDAIYDKVMDDMQKGRISIEDIEEALGDRTELDSLTKESEEFNTLFNTPSMQLSKAQQNRLAELEAKNETTPYKNALDGAKEQVSKSVYEMLKGERKGQGSYLLESYNEKARKGQALEINADDYSKFKNQDAVKATIDSALKVGANNTRTVHDIVDFGVNVASHTGLKVEFTTNEQAKATFIENQTKKINQLESLASLTEAQKQELAKLKETLQKVQDGKIKVNGNITSDGISLNLDSSKALESILGHEVTHAFEKAKNYDKLVKTLKSFLGAKTFNKKLEDLKDTYAGVDEANAERELVADLVGEYLFTDEKFVNHLFTTDRNLFQKIFDEIKYLYKMATAGSKEARKLEEVKHTFEKVWRESGQKNTTEESGTKYALSRDVDGNVFVDVTEDIFDENNGESIARTIQRVIHDKFNNLIDVHGQKIQINKTTNDEFRRSESAISLLKNSTQTYNDKLKTIANADEILSAAKNWIGEEIQHTRSDDIVEFARGNITYRVGENGYVADVIVGTRKNGSAVLYDLVNIYSKKIAEAPVTMASNENFQRRQGTSADDIISQNSKKSIENEKISTDDSDIKTMEGGSVTKYSLSTWTPETQAKVRENLIKSGFDSNQVDKWIKDTNSIASVIAADKDRLDFEAADNQVMLKDNQEYVKTLDASTLCAKRLVYQGTFDAIQHRMPNQVLSSDDLIDLLNMMKEHGVQTPCGVCYVESRRRHLGKFAQGWLDTYNGEYKPNLDEVTTSDGLEALRKTHPQTYKDFVDAMNKKGSSNPKVVQLRTEYRNEIMKLTPKQIKAIESIGGLRVQSFSDFETPHMLDMMQAVMDMSAKGLHSQAYTKVPNFAWVFGDTGIKINLSLIAEGDGFDADGNLAFSSTEGMDINEAMKLRDAYSQNVGTIIVGANDAHILACMADDRIDFIIPFHRSGWGMKELEMMGMSSYTDYTYGQKEHDLATGKGIANLYPADYWDYSISGKENAERYLNLCAKTGREPKFSKFLVNNSDGSYSLQPDGSTDGYWKTLIDFKMYDNEGNGASQQKVQPNFNMSEAYRVLDEYEGGANKLPVANDVVDEFVAKYQSTHDIAPTDYSLSQEGETSNGRFYGKDMMLDAPVGDSNMETTTSSPKVDNISDETAPVVEDVPVAEDVPTPITTVKERIETKLANVEQEILNNSQLRADSFTDFTREIERLEKEYSAKKNKNTKVANDILRRIERLQTMRNNVDADYEKRINDLTTKAEKMKTPAYQTAMQRQAKTQEYTEWAENLIGDTTTWVDKKLGLSYKTNTLKRNLRDVVRDAQGNRDIAKADAIYDELQGKYNHNEAELNRESNRIKKVFADMKITSAEDTYIQMLGEFKYNPETTLKADDVNKFYEANKSKIDVDKVNNAIELARENYDSLLERVNEVLREQGMKEIPYRKGYFPHFTDTKQSWLAKLFNWKTQDTEIPTSIAGITEQFNPNRSWQSFNKQRLTDTTDYSFTKGFDTYVHGALDWVYHIEDIQKRRAFENELRYIHSEQGIKDRVEALFNNEEYDADELQEQIDLVYAEARNPLNNFVTDLRAGTNKLANKKSSMDRGVEEMTNRKFYSTMTNLSNRVSANMVGGSVSSALTNFIPITQSWGEVSPISSLKAMGETIRATFRDDGVIDKSDFLTNRLNKADNLYKTNWDKISNGLGAMMEGIDSFTSQTVWRSKYLENISNGMSESEAIKNADEFAEGVIAGRSRGNQPTLFDSKNPLIKTLTAFQLEVNNQYGYMFKDMPQNMQNESKGKLVKGYAAMFIGAYAYNALYSALTGRDAAFDPIRIIQEFIGDLFDDEEEEAPLNATLGLAENVAQELPFVGGLLGGGRVPISSALPYDGNLMDIFEGTANALNGEDVETATKEWLKPLYYLAMPMGGGQLKKTIEGLSMFSDEHPIAGSYTDSGNLRFPVEETFGNKLQAAIFGQYANKNAQYYFDNDIAPLKENQIQEFIDVNKTGMSIQDYWSYREGMSGLKTLAEKADYINSLNLTNEQKNILINNIADRKEGIDMTDYGNYGSFEEFDFANKYPSKYEVAKTVGGYDAYKTYSSALNDITSDKDANGKTISGSRKEKVVNYINNLDADYGTKIILFKSEYKSDNTYNHDIIDYLNNRDDISYEQMKTILIELGFKVDSKGNVTWD